MDLFGFNDDDDKTPKDINPIISLGREAENKILINMAISKYKKSLVGLFIIFGLIIIVLNVILVPYFFNNTLEERIGEIELSTARLRNLPDNYEMVGVNVGAVTIDSVVELNCSSATSSCAGSGFIINEQGYVITNAHVITYEKGNFFSTTTVAYTTIKAYFYNDETDYNMTVVNYDLTLDLAILKFNNPPSDLSPVIFGSSELLSLGEEVVAIGNAEGLGLALTVGVVSDPLKEFDDGTSAIQTDAAINPGNSGGPLFNVYAELVGVTTFKIIDTDANEGMGFAIPSSDVIDFINSTESSKGITINYTESEDEV